MEFIVEIIALLRARFRDRFHRARESRFPRMGRGAAGAVVNGYRLRVIGRNRWSAAVL